MSRKAPFAIKPNLFIVIRKAEKEMPSKALVKAFCEDYFNEYVMVDHKKDIKPITQVEITKYYYIVGIAKKDNPALWIHLENIVKYFNFKDDEGIWVDKVDNFVKNIRCIAHKYNTEMTQHETNDIVTNIKEEDMRLILGDDLELKVKKEGER